ncbi:hypothetical protein ACFWAY_53165 [Rhodococcus sp. NPDC059968]|uniref:hypothetical protein n=1 Tax=Rhodococcus sp. NPDC059968 TaxID=3347017 RepID=UPI003671F8FC
MLKLRDAAEALPTVRDTPDRNNQSMTANLEELLSIEVESTEARRLAGSVAVRVPADACVARGLRLRRRSNPRSKD